VIHLPPKKLPSLVDLHCNGCKALNLSFGYVLIGLEQKQEGKFYGLKANSKISGDLIYIDMNLVMKSLGIDLKDENVPRPFFKRYDDESFACSESETSF